MVMAERLRQNGNKTAERTGNAAGRTRVSIQMKSPAEYEAGEPFEDIQICYASDRSEKSPARDLRQQPARSSVVQGYVKSAPWVLAAKKDTEPRKIMVKGGEPATLYLRQGTPAPEQLGRLGIVSSGQMFDDPLHEVAAKFVKYVQGQIPASSKSWWVWFKHWWDPQKNPYSPVQGKRSAGEKEKAGRRLRAQREALDSAVALAQNALAALHATRKQEEIANVHTQVDAFISEKYGITDTMIDLRKTVNDDDDDTRKEQRISMGTLGPDIVEAVMALYQATMPLGGDEVREISDRTLLLELAQAEFSYRRAQVEAEERVIEWKPLAPTACDTSAVFRATRLGNPEDAEKFNFSSEQFNDVMPWNFHVATDIDVKSLTDDDRLFIEDAAGKSSHEWEAAGAHWAAYIYGKEESDHLVNRFPKASSSIFNQMSREWRNDYITANQKAVDRDENKGIVLELMKSVRPVGDCKIRATINDEKKIVYMKENPEGDPNIEQSATLDFMMRTADKVLDRMVLRDYTHKGMRSKFTDLAGKTGRYLDEKLSDGMVLTPHDDIWKRDIMKGREFRLEEVR